MVPERQLEAREDREFLFTWVIRAGTCGHAEAQGQALGKQMKPILQGLGAIQLSQAGNTQEQGWPYYSTVQCGWYHSSKALYYHIGQLCT